MVYNPVRSEGQMTRSSVPGDTMVNMPVASTEFGASPNDLRQNRDVKGRLVTTLSMWSAGRITILKVQVAMHVVASQPTPLSVDRTGIPAAVVAAEKEVFVTRAKESGTKSVPCRATTSFRSTNWSRKPSPRQS